MSNASTKKVFIQIETAAEQQEHLKSQRKTFKVLQGVSTDKENLTGRPQIDKLSRLKAATDVTLASTEHSKRKKIETRSVDTQTSPEKKLGVSEITVEDLTSDSAPSEFYWERLAERRREALQESLTENQRLHERIEGLEEELDTSRKQLEEAHTLVEVLKEMLSESDVEQEIGAETESGDGDGDDNDNDNRSTDKAAVEAKQPESHTP